MKNVVIAAGFLATALVCGTASAAEFECKSGGRIERRGSTWGAAARSGSDWRIEKSSSTIGYAKRAGSDWRIETSGSSTLGYLKGHRIEKSNGSTWADADRALRLANCKRPIAAALWILKRDGRL